MKLPSALVVIFLLNFSLQSDSWDDDYTVMQLADILPPEDVPYDEDAPPKFRMHPAIVFMHITLLMMDSFDQNEMTFTTGETCQPAAAGQLVTRHVPGPHLEGPQAETAQVRGGGHLQDPGRQVDTTHLET